MSSRASADQPAEPFAYSIPDACRVAGGVGRSTLYAEIKSGSLNVLKIGDRTLVEREELRRWLATKRQMRGE